MPCEVRVLGAGPAGCAAARLLSQWGHEVNSSRRRTERRDGCPSRFPSTRKLFDVLGVREAIDEAPFIRATGNTVWWGSGETRIESFPASTHGWQVTADRLHEVLRAAAAQVGVRLLDRRATEADLAPDGPLILDCTGRAGVVSRHHHLRIYEDGPRTVAIGRWRLGPAFVVPEPTHTLIESYDDGWARSGTAGSG